jgi:hypothetical protein
LAVGEDAESKLDVYEAATGGSTVERMENSQKYRYHE